MASIDLQQISGLYHRARIQETDARPDLAGAREAYQLALGVANGSSDEEAKATGLYMSVEIARLTVALSIDPNTHIRDLAYSDEWENALAMLRAACQEFQPRLEEANRVVQRAGFLTKKDAVYQRGQLALQAARARRLISYLHGFRAVYAADESVQLTETALATNYDHDALTSIKLVGEPALSAREAANSALLSTMLRDTAGTKNARNDARSRLFSSERTELQKSVIQTELGRTAVASRISGATEILIATQFFVAP